MCQHFHFVIQRTCTYLGSFFFRILHQIIESIMCNDLLTPIKLVMNCRRRLRLRKSRHRSMYRDIVFLAFVACGKENIDNGKDILVDKMYLGQILKYFKQNYNHLCLLFFFLQMLSIVNTDKHSTNFHTWKSSERRETTDLAKPESFGVEKCSGN